MPHSDILGQGPVVFDRAQLLVVDDDPQLGEALRLLFRAQGYYVVAVQSGRAALEVLSRLQVDLVITDMFMPDGDGLELVPALIKSECQPAVIAMSGRNYSVLHDILRMARELGAAHSLQKPFTLEEILEAVKGILATRVRKNFVPVRRSTIRLTLADLPSRGAQ